MSSPDAKTDPKSGPRGLHPTGRTPSVCVYCGAKPGRNPAFRAAAEAFGAGLAGRGWRLVYGAGDLGLMGAVATACLDAGGEAFGVIPQGLWEREIAKRDLPHVVVAESLHQRKSLMLRNADAVAVLPGGLGTLDEIAECVTWAQLGIHAKPIVMLDAEGYWGPLRALFDHMADQGFLHSGLERHLLWADDAAGALALLEAEIAGAPPLL
ncbi:MAG: TIGR00730 family Rossman fold protein [Pseudomonadota bacterium]